MDELTQRLRSIYAGSIEDGLESWLTDAILARLLAEAVVVQPSQCVLYSQGEPLRCHANPISAGKAAALFRSTSTPHTAY